MGFVLRTDQPPDSTKGLMKFDGFLDQL